MDVSTEGRELIKQFKGISLTAYRCLAGVPTIGVGHTAGVQMGDTITPAQADAYLAADLVSYGQNVERLLAGAPTSQHEFDALVSLAFNIGIGGFGGSTVLRLHKAGDKLGAARAFEMWCKATVGGQLQTVPGLLSRRQREAAYYLTPDAPAVKAMPQAVEPPPPPGTSRTVIAGSASVAAGAASVATQIDQITPVIEKVTQVGMSMQSLLKVSALALSIVAVGAAVYVLVRYINKLKAGQVVSK
jgi:lysozyme